ncbi:hypothetical protein CCAX7_007990 [Capsulimonas corticalis]|uniref:Uncharacterized protein n=1 Tax=Capsulimonas corticalis TaxID=2219043 RepID=A0A402CTV5_9BACT|nr:hypothetical protein CCAX7_007990 [Capsulimonas corticalis]
MTMMRVRDYFFGKETRVITIVSEEILPYRKFGDDLCRPRSIIGGDARWSIKIMTEFDDLIIRSAFAGIEIN